MASELAPRGAYGWGSGRRGAPLAALLALLALPMDAVAERSTFFGDLVEAKADGVWFSLSGELGFLAVADHIVQLSEDGTRFDYTEDGGQDVLFNFARLSVDAVFETRHRVTFLFQPLELRGETVFSRDHVFDGLTFPEGTPVDNRYSFPFWRLSYAYDFLPSRRHEASLGGSLQIRDATITFTSADGTLRRARRGVGPVPLIRFRGRYGFDNGWWLGTELDGMYAPISVINGSDNEVTGALVDWSVRAGYALPLGVEPFVNLRYLAGGAVGDSDPESPGSDGFTRNWLHFVTVSLGANLHLL